MTGAGVYVDYGGVMMCAGVCRSCATVVTRNSHAADAPDSGSGGFPNGMIRYVFTNYPRLDEILLPV